MTAFRIRVRGSYQVFLEWEEALTFGPLLGGLYSSKGRIAFGRQKGGAETWINAYLKGLKGS